MVSSLIPGSLYRLTATIKIGSCVLEEGDVLVYSSGGYSPYDDCYIYNFQTALGEKCICVSQKALTVEEISKFAETFR